RVCLDIGGKIPPASEVRAFLRDAAPEKKQRVVEQILDGPGYIQHFTGVWRNLLLPEMENDFQVRYGSMGFERWLRKRFSENVGWDQMVRELITAPISGDNRMYFDYYGRAGEPNPMVFYQAKGGKAENLAATTARLFLGVRIECAQCHDHPFA